ncbi:MOSC domain-containing protein [Vibrio nigripulchritudo]|uniref:MOSC domain-containing protein n=1 Tax=Vibrio nigripulchritudo TaxID=28173 RepID=UPI0003B1EC64|nr:MOSC domain-containing protein [Vibrio nigripulchritudo]CCN72953.1 putative Molybdenum cofactor sulfurase [Vibrio nigripulchritudo SFn118]
MKKIGTVESVLSGKTQPYSRGAVSSIDKKIQSGRLYANSLGFTNDEQGDPRFHGGIEKALHMYPSEHYPKWCEELGNKPIFEQVGAFGENLSSSGITESQICIGDKIKIGSTLLEVSQGRMPCWKLNDRCEEPDMALRLQMTMRTGWYFRVIEEGEIGAGDDILLIERPHPDFSLARIMGAVYRGILDKKELESLVEVPLVDSWRALIEKRIETGTVENWAFRLFGSTS